MDNKPFPTPIGAKAIGMPPYLHQFEFAKQVLIGLVFEYEYMLLMNDFNGEQLMKEIELRWNLFSELNETISKISEIVVNSEGEIPNLELRGNVLRVLEIFNALREKRNEKEQVQSPTSC